MISAWPDGSLSAFSQKEVQCLGICYIIRFVAPRSRPPPITRQPRIRSANLRIRRRAILVSPTRPAYGQARRASGVRTRTRICPRSSGQVSGGHRAGVGDWRRAMAGDGNPSAWLHADILRKDWGVSRILHILTTLVIFAANPRLEQLANSSYGAPPFGEHSAPTADCFYSPRPCDYPSRPLPSTSLGVGAGLHSAMPSDLLLSQSPSRSTRAPLGHCPSQRRPARQLHRQTRFSPDPASQNCSRLVAPRSSLASVRHCLHQLLPADDELHRPTPGSSASRDPLTTADPGGCRREHLFPSNEEQSNVRMADYLGRGYPRWNAQARRAPAQAIQAQSRLSAWRAPRGAGSLGGVRALERPRRFSHARGSRLTRRPHGDRKGSVAQLSPRTGADSSTEAREAPRPAGDGR
jgi:hypothetical protein